MDVVLICGLLLAVGLVIVVAVTLLGELILLVGLAAMAALDLGANLSAVLWGRPRSHRY